MSSARPAPRRLACLCQQLRPAPTAAVTEGINHEEGLYGATYDGLTATIQRGMQVRFQKKAFESTRTC
jgi:hypothetical protein